MNISIGNLIDQLSIENIRIWMAEDLKRTGRDEDIIKGTKITNSANTRRNKLIQAIDEALGTTSNQGDNKLYK